MTLAVTKSSGSKDDKDLAVPVEDGSDLLHECAGGCGNKILMFGVLNMEDWGRAAEGALCLECKMKPLKHDPKKKS